MDRLHISINFMCENTIGKNKLIQTKSSYLVSTPLYEKMKSIERHLVTRNEDVRNTAEESYSPLAIMRNSSHYVYM